MTLTVYWCDVCQLSGDHEKEVEELWAALVACWPVNLSIIMRYLVIIVGMYPQLMLSWVST